MKKLSKLFLLLIMLIPFVVRAATNITLNDNIKITSGKNGSMLLTANFDNAPGELTKISFKVTIDDKNKSIKSHSLTKMSAISKWGRPDDGPITYTFTKGNDGESIESGDSLAEIEFVTNASATDGDVINVTISDVKYYFNVEGEEEPTVISGASSSKAITIAKEEPSSEQSNVALLNSLTVSQGELNPVFDPNTDSYYVEVKDTINKITVNATCSDKCSSLNQSTNQSYKSQVTLAANDITKITITVISENGKNAKTYTVNVARGEVTNDTANLSSLEITGHSLTPGFSADVLEYTLEVDKEVNELEIKYTATHEDAKVEVIGDKTLYPGENIVKVIVTSEDGNTTKTYVITVIKESDEDVSSEDAVITAPNDKKKPKIWLIILIIVASLTVIGLVAFFIFRKKKNDAEIDAQIESIEPDATIDHKDDEELLELTKEFSSEEINQAASETQEEVIESDYGKF